MAYKHNPNHKIPMDERPSQNKATYVEHDPVAERGKPMSESPSLNEQQEYHIKTSKNLSRETGETLLSRSYGRSKEKGGYESERQQAQEKIDYLNKMAKKKIKSGLGNKK